MSAPACIVFYGLRFDVAEQEIEHLEERRDDRLKAARKAGVKSYWANFGAPGNHYLLFIGAQLGVLGQENSAESIYSSEALDELMRSTRAKLLAAGFEDMPSLYMQWLNDA